MKTNKNGRENKNAQRKRGIQTSEKDIHFEFVIILWMLVTQKDSDFLFHPKPYCM
jgi:hypothetical protein